MYECKKCGNRKISISYVPEGSIIPKDQVDWDSHFIVEEYEEGIDKEWVPKASFEHLYKKCDTCKYDWRENIVDNNGRG